MPSFRLALRGPLSERRFRALWLGQTCSAIGDQLVPIALAFAVIELTGSASDLGLVLAASLVPRLLFLLAGGVWADRLPRQRVMLAADVVRGAAQALVAVDLLAGSPQIWHLVVLAAVEGAASAFFAPAVLGLVSAVVEPERLQAANALMGMSRNLAGIAGPALAGTLVALSSAGVAFALDAATFAVSVLTLAAITLPHVPVARRPFGQELREGLQEMLDRPWYWSNLVTHSLWNGLMSAFYVLGPLVAVRELGGAAAWGTIMVAGAIGSVVAGALSLKARPRHPLVTANLALALAGLPLLALAGPLPTGVVALCSAAAFGGLAYMSTLWETAVQKHIPPQAMSRVFAWDWLASLVVAPVGRAVVGPLAVAVGTGTTLAGAGILLAASSLGVIAVPSVRGLRAG